MFDHSSYLKKLKLLFILFVTCFIIKSSLSMTYPFFIFAQIFQIKRMVKRCKKKVKATSIMERGW